MDLGNHIKQKPLGYGKKLYIMEFLAERAIQIVAILSIGFILAIFYYVFQESFYAFQDDKKETAYSATEAIGAPVEKGQGDLKPESYSAGATETDLKPESYSPSAKPEAQQELKPETYGAKSANENNKIINEKKKVSASTASEVAELKPETYGSENQPQTAVETAQSDTPRTSPAIGGANVEEPKLNPSVFIKPNDIIDGKPAYIWQPVSAVPKYSFVPLFVGALKVTLIAILIAAPVAILAALFTVAFAPKKLREIIKPAIEILAGFPSIVIGFFCLITLATIVQNVFGTAYRLNSFVGGLGMALAVIPIIYTVTEDALSAVPKFMSEASLALGASKWETAYRVMLPAATPGVFAAIILGFGRAFGETMIALMATGNAALVSADIFESVRTMAATIGAEMAEVEFRSAHYGVLFLIGSILFIITFALNAVAEFYVRRKLLKKFQGV